MMNPLFWLFWAVLFDATPDASPNQAKPASALSLDVFAVRSTTALSQNVKPLYRLSKDLLPVSSSTTSPRKEKPAFWLFWAVLFDATPDAF